MFKLSEDIIDNKTTQINLANIEEAHAIVAAMKGISVNQFRLVASSEADLHLVWDAEGGKKKKRKKKAFTTKKRVPHTRKKEKLKMLKLFTVKDGNAEAKRAICPNCPGCFLAKHKDGRLYCGNCHTNQAK